jgi:hypothetical protein
MPRCTEMYRKGTRIYAGESLGGWLQDCIFFPSFSVWGTKALSGSSRVAGSERARERERGEKLRSVSRAPAATNNPGGDRVCPCHSSWLQVSALFTRFFRSRGVYSQRRKENNSSWLVAASLHLEVLRRAWCTWTLPSFLTCC